jgi:hypothetical protein
LLDLPLRFVGTRPVVAHMPAQPAPASGRM